MSLCYHEADEAQVLQIGEKLKAAEILPWWDTVDVQPGLLVRAQQEELIEAIPAITVCVDKPATERGQALHIYAFIDQFVQRRVPVIPVLLAESPAKVPPFLALFRWVDVRKKVPDPVGQLIWELRGSGQRRRSGLRNVLAEPDRDDKMQALPTKLQREVERRGRCMNQLSANEQSRYTSNDMQNAAQHAHQAHEDASSSKVAIQCCPCIPRHSIEA